MLAVLNLVLFRGGSALAFQIPRTVCKKPALNKSQVIRDVAALFDILLYTCGSKSHLSENI